MIQTSGNWFRGINVDIKTIQLLNYLPDIIDSENCTANSITHIIKST